MRLLLLLGLWSTAQCFLIVPDGSPAIVDGENAAVGEFPFIVSLTKASWGGRLFFCGGSLLTERIVITAGHCLVGEQSRPSNVLVVAGHHNRTENSTRVQRIKLEEVAVHPNYNHTPETRRTNFSIQYDIALGLLSTAFVLNEGIVEVVRIPINANDLFEGRQATAAGWGYTRLGMQPNTLQKIRLNVLTNSDCQKEFGTHPKIRDMEICANRSRYGGICSGDSGGPLLVKNSEDDFVLVGITSWARACTRGQWPGVFARVSTHLEWINETATELEEEDSTKKNPKFKVKMLF